MNRLIIIGNGFDLAHGLPTGYCDFINKYWNNVFNNFKNPYQYIFDYEDELIRFNFNILNLPMQIVEDFRTINNHLEYIEFVRRWSQLWIDTDGFNYIDFTPNSFFQIINDRHHIQNWVDIENEYYRLLKNCLKDDNNLDAKKLNDEFEEVKNLLEKYLEQNINKRYNFDESPKNAHVLVELFEVKYRSLKNTIYNNFLREFSSDDHNQLRSFDANLEKYNNGNSTDITDLVKSGGFEVKNLFLNFNYTRTADIYENLIFNSKDKYYGKNQVIQIHGRLNDDGNKINFGFGDEMDNHYKLIEEKDDNEYLKNIKSFQYLQNSNYKNMLDFIESDKFQVFIMGHSCGLSDRILLNKIFENHNCRSIKVFYHQFDEPKDDGRTDNYTEIVQNISRHFNKKDMMREKIVNKSLCQPLPQDIRFAPKENGSQL